MTKGARMKGADLHRKMGVDLFNFAWTLLENRRRTRSEDDLMIHATHASRYHWTRARGATPKNDAIGEWQISRVYAVLRRAEPALYHARRTLAICESNGLEDFPLAYAHEALARAYAVGGERRLRDRHLRLAKAAGEHIHEAEDRALLLADLRTLPRPRTR